MSLRFAPEISLRMRRALMSRGQALAGMLADVLAGKHPRSLEALLSERPGARPEEVLRLALDQVESRRKLIDADDDRNGRCDICGEDLGEAAMLEVPWADRCHAHLSA
jgi:hypothetical protein